MSCCLCFNSRYVRLTEDVVVETSEDHSWGRYYFRPRNKTNTKAIVEEPEETYNDDMASVKERHRFSSLLDANILFATNTHPSLPQWKVMYRDAVLGTCIWEKAGVCHVLTHESKGVFAEEVAKVFFDPKDKDWDPSVQSYDIIENITDMAYVAHYVFKPVWPATQRESVICCEIQELEHGTWVVSSQSVDHEMRPKVSLLPFFLFFLN